MANSATIFNIDAADFPSDLLRKLSARAKEENVSLSKYIAAMLRHALRGDNLANIHFYQDGSGDTYNVEALEKMFAQSDEEDAKGELKTFNGPEEGLAYLREIRETIEAKRH